MKTIRTVLFGLLLWAAPSAVQAQYFTNTDGSIYYLGTNGGTIVIYLYIGGPGGALTIPTNINGLPVTSIEVAAFQGSSLTGVTIPGSITSIGNSVFTGCAHLTNLLLGYGITNIGEGAFDECNGLTRVTIPGSVTSFGEDAFSSCASLTNVTLEEGITNIPDDEFAHCSNLTSVSIPDSVTSIGVFAFGVCSSLPAVTIPNAVSYIGDAAFASCLSLTNMTIPGGITNIGPFLFANCSNLVSVYFLGNAPAAGEGTFNEDIATVYYLPSTIGWSNSFADVSALLWNPQPQTSDASFGVRSNQFGFTITGTTNIPIVVQASTSLANPIWTALTNVLLTNGSFYFSDPQWTNFPGRYYRISAP